jgi:hypothetical protein
MIAELVDTRPRINIRTYEQKLKQEEGWHITLPPQKFIKVLSDFPMDIVFVTPDGSLVEAQYFDIIIELLTDIPPEIIRDSHFMSKPQFVYMMLMQKLKATEETIIDKIKDCKHPEALKVACWKWRKV